MQIVCTMTSWKGRIKFVGRAIFYFLSKQTIKPDLFYLWLSEEEFPKKEKELPEDLLLICNQFKIKIQWIKQNEFCFKRWYIYPKHWEDFVVCIDDDKAYKPNTIELGLKYYKKFNNTVFSIADLKYSRQFNNSIHNELKKFYSDKPDFRYCFCGQCIIPPKCFPLDCWTPEQIEIRKKICKKCDESWINPWLVKNNIKIFCIKELHPTELPNSQKTALWHEMGSRIKSNINKRDLQLFDVLKSNAELMKAWKKVFPKYKW